ncbi:alpha-protein kinase 2 isoform X2 [Pangasianodon hypophthalmus]|uniref:alpha-protein kinase 2 isoform X2 n=1 Tax=Pangasianodon hypophthalmus TaxID=310915 RepID=UPI002307991E|nr:alpha-protein kinase 2 isoform X2 [Pangasianodon hypophthalmus]
MSEGIDGNEGIVELPENVTSQDVEVDGNKSNILPKGHQNATLNPNDHMTSRNQENEVPENRQCQKAVNTAPTNRQSQDESPSLDPNSETTTIDDIPNTEFHPAWISRTVYNADTHRNYLMDEAVQHVDPQIKGIAGETVQDISEISSILQENVYHIGSEIHDFVVTRALNSDSEIGGILEDAVQSKDSEIGGILEDTVQSNESEIAFILEDTVQSSESEIGGILEDSLQSNNSEICAILEDAVQSKESEIGGILEDTVQSNNSETGGILEDTVQSNDSEIECILEDAVQSTASEIGGILEDAVQSKESQIGGILEDTVQSNNSETGGILEDTVQSNDSEIGGILEDSLQSKESEIGGILEDTVQSNNSETGGILEDNVQSKDSEIGGILEDNFQSNDSEIECILEDAVQSNNSEMCGILEDTVQSTASEIHGILEDSIQTQENVYHIDSEICGFVVDKTQTSHSEIGGILEDTIQSTDSEIHGVLEDTVQSTDSKIGEVLEDNVQSINVEIGGILGDASGLLQQPFPLYSAELSNNKTLEANDNNAMSDILTDSAANLAENDVTQMSRTVNAKTEMESASCILEDHVPDMTVDLTPENNSDVDLLISSFPHTQIIIPSKTEEGIDEDHSEVTQVMDRSDMSNELWVDALDEWGHLPASCPTAASSDNTRTSKMEAKIGSLELPTIERWSSSDSWASALSDWIQSVSVLPEDCPTMRSPESQHQFSMAIQDMTKQKTTGPESSLEVGDGDSEGKMLIKNSTSPPTDLSLLHREERENSLYTNLDMNRTQDFPEDKEGETQSGLQEKAEDSRNDCTEGKPENKCAFVSKKSNAVWKVTEDTAFEEKGERNHGALSFSCHPITPESEVHLLNSYEADHLTRMQGVNRSDATHIKDSRSCVFPNVGEVDFIMPLTPITIGTSFLHLKEDPEESRTSLKLCLAGINDEIRPDLTPRASGKSTSESSDNQFGDITKKTGDQGPSLSSYEDPKYKTEADDVSSELQTLILPTGEQLMICEEKHVAYVTLDVDDILSFKNHPEDWSAIKQVSWEVKQSCERDSKMPHKTQKTSSENKTRSNKHKDKTSNNQQLGCQTKKRENVRPESHGEESRGAEESTVTMIETIVITEKVTSRSQGKKKKKHGVAKVENEPLLEVENGTKPKNAKPKNETATTQPSKVREKLAKYEGKASNENDKASEEKTKPSTETSSTCLPGALDDDIVKRRRISGDKPGSISIRTRPQLPAIFQQKKKEDVVKEKIQTPKEVPRVISEIEAAPVVDDPQSISLWCRFSPIVSDSSIIWVKEGATLCEEKMKVGDDGRLSLSVVKACSKDLGFYRCTLTSALGSVSTSDYHLTSEVLMELVIPNHDTPAERKAIDGEEEDVSCTPLLFKDDILSDQYFGEQQHTSIVTEKAHFGEGMHRKAFRTMVRTSMTPLFGPGHACVLKVHSSIGYGTLNNDEVIQKNYNLAVEECYVQNTAREYIKAYTNVAKSAESFGEVPEIIPIFLVHRPSNAVPYATLEEELIGDFVKYSVKDGKEINLMRRDSEAGQKCCAFQHWVYTQTDGNLLVTDMQGVGMKLTDVGIATCKKGYKGFKGNCSTSFIDQFKALHQCNRFCELLGLTSLQPKAKRTTPPKPKAQPAARKKPFGPSLKGKS